MGVVILKKFWVVLNWGCRLGGWPNEGLRFCCEKLFCKLLRWPIGLRLWWYFFVEKFCYVNCLASRLSEEWVLIERKKFWCVFGGGLTGWKIILSAESLILVVCCEDGRIGWSPNLISWVDVAEYGLLLLRRFLYENFCAFCSLL